LALKERIWHDNAWQRIESFELETRLKNEGLLDLTGALTEDGRLLAIFNTQTILQNDQLSGFEVVGGVELGGQQTAIAQLIDNVPQNNLLYTYRTVDLPVGNISESQVPDAEPSVNSVSTTSPELVSTPDPSLIETKINEQVEIDTANMTSNTEESNSNTVSILTALIPTLLVVLIVFAIGIRRALPKR
jgi:hypothetical protein